MVAARLATLKRGDNQYKKEGPPNGGPSVEQAAEMLGVGTRSVESAKQVLEHGSKDVIEAVASRVRARRLRLGQGSNKVGPLVLHPACVRGCE
jgi:hypothetical protein